MHLNAKGLIRKITFSLSVFQVQEVSFESRPLFLADTTLLLIFVNDSRIQYTRSVLVHLIDSQTCLFCRGFFYLKRHPLGHAFPLLF